ncbi:MAG: hypothetical protein NTY90_03885 [Candidatus Micrarchaeota archaeon]|nr:hypothetical protein [Candidatus Micrarchaeota archaeon]
MATITVNVNDAVAKKFREMAALAFGKTKGSLGKAVSEAFSLWVQLKREKKAGARMLDILEDGLDLGGVAFTREQLHERGG